MLLYHELKISICIPMKIRCPPLRLYPEMYKYFSSIFAISCEKKNNYMIKIIVFNKHVFFICLLIFIYLFIYLRFTLSKAK